MIMFTYAAAKAGTVQTTIKILTHIQTLVERFRECLKLISAVNKNKSFEQIVRKLRKTFINEK